jgi:TetR/AcrR family transcriptional regulator, mexJK operon transcriptional repressor
MGATYALLLERGVASTTMYAVAERASVSKMTVYANFRDKPALLSAVGGRRIKLLHVSDLAVGPDLNSSVERLVEVGEQVASSAVRPEVVRMVRLMTECADEHPRLAAAFYTAGRGELLKRVAGFLTVLTRRGFLSIKEPELAAEQLVASWLWLGRQTFGLAGPPSADAIAKRVRYSVDTLVRAWSATPPGAKKTLL